MNGTRRKLPSGNYQVRWINPDGIHGSRTVPNAQAAEKVLAKVRTATGSGEWPFADEDPGVDPGRSRELGVISSPQLDEIQGKAQLAIGRGATSLDSAGVWPSALIGLLRRPRSQVPDTVEGDDSFGSRNELHRVDPRRSDRLLAPLV